MKALSLFVISMLFGVAPVAAKNANVRPMDRMSMAAYEFGQLRSEHFRVLVSELEASDVIVHVVTTHELPPGIVGTMRFVTLIEGVRYVRVHLSASLALKLRVAMLAHELQHACELARSVAASSDDVRSLYMAIGKPARGFEDEFETSAAEQAGWTVWEELGGVGLRAEAGDR